MSKGKARVEYHHTKGVDVSDVSSWGHIYQTSLVRDEEWRIGDRYVLPDGRVFRYAKSGSALNNDFACKFAEDECQGYEALKDAQAVGDMEVTFTGAAHAVLSKDDLRGGYVIIYHTGGGGDTQFRGIIGNTASALNSNVTVYLDGPLDHAVIAASTGAEIFYNPYANLLNVSGGDYSFAGKPAVQVDATDTYFWVQTWGPCWIAPNIVDSSFATTQHRAAYFRNDGSIEGDIAHASRDTYHPDQLAGFLINEGYSAGPLLMLTISP